MNHIQERRLQIPGPSSIEHYAETHGQPAEHTLWKCLVTDTEQGETTLYATRLKQALLDGDQRPHKAPDWQRGD
jgi:hypothetical protein